MTCRPTRSLIQEWPTAALAPSQKKDIEQHTATCTPCRDLLLSTEAMEAQLTAPIQVKTPPHLADVIRAQTTAHANQSRSKATTPARGRAMSRPVWVLPLSGGMISAGVLTYQWLIGHNTIQPGAPFLNNWSSSIIHMPVWEPTTALLAGGLLLFLMGVFGMTAAGNHYRHG